MNGWVNNGREADEIMSNAAVSTGLPHPPEVQEEHKTVVGGRPLAIEWITDELIEEHRRVWSCMYRRIITEEEAIEIIMNIKQFAETILEATAQEGET